MLELLVATTLAAILTLGLVKMVTASGAAATLQDNEATLQDRERYAARVLADAVGSAGFSPQPWNPALDRKAIAPDTADHVTARSDRLVVQEWSDRNCFDNLNPVRDGAGKPVFHLLENAFDLNSSHHLAKSCRYGPDASNLVTQVRRQGLVPGVESFQLLYGQDADADGNVERWVRAGAWTAETDVRAVRIGLLLAGPDPVGGSARREFRVLDTTVSMPRDGRLRRPLELAFTIRGRRG